MPDQDRAELVDEAVEIFLALRAAPSDPAMLQSREAFRSRGPEERRVYEEVVRAWGTAAIAGRPRVRGRFVAMSALVAVLAAAFFGPDALVYLRSDFHSGDLPARVQLASGDMMDLDANSAIEDESDAADRRIRLLRGAAFFDVERDGRPFVVEAEEVTVSVLGTSFEVAQTGSATIVGVLEGAVSVEFRGETRQITAGERLLATEGGGLTQGSVDPSTIASWRNNQLIADGLTFQDLSDIIERRLSGAVVVVGDDLKRTRITGGFDLSDPVTALRAMAALTGARVVAVPPAVTLIFDPDL